MGRGLIFDVAEGWHDIRNGIKNTELPKIIFNDDNYFGMSKSGELEVFISKNKIYKGYFGQWYHHSSKDPGMGFVWTDENGNVGYGIKKVKAWRYVLV